MGHYVGHMGQVWVMNGSTIGHIWVVWVNYRIYMGQLGHIVWVIWVMYMGQPWVGVADSWTHGLMTMSHPAIILHRKTIELAIQIALCTALCTVHLQEACRC